MSITPRGDLGISAADVLVGMTNKIQVSVAVISHHSPACYAFVWVNDTLHAQARGRSRSDAVSEAVRQFRLARADRLTSARKR